MTLNDIKRMFNVTKTQYEFRLYKDIVLKINEIVKITEYINPSAHGESTVRY